ncbi:protein spire homolog 2 isoform X2 [Marmota monax]|uniref:protein spire homolog 2 isoform X2 n=1 Tax=Marmota monax TaxID=9995 RepID=UPI0026EECC39|nr:protein spire homolog 2 isoform X2 [Marmota monax]
MARAGGGGGAAAPERAGAAARRAPWELSLEEVLKVYEQPINEEQAWAVCFQACRGLRGAPGGRRRIRDTADLLLHRDGSVGARQEPDGAVAGLCHLPRAGLGPGRERGARAQPTAGAAHRPHGQQRLRGQRLWGSGRGLRGSRGGGGGCRRWPPGPAHLLPGHAAVRCAPDRPSGRAGPLPGCVSRTLCGDAGATGLPSQGPGGQGDVWSQMLQKLGEDEPQVEKPPAELDNLGHTDWARLWVQLMRELRHGVKLKKVQEQEFNPLPTEFQLTPFEMLMQDIRARNYQLRKVMVDGDIPPRVKKDAHELILDFIRSRPPLKQVPMLCLLQGVPEPGAVLCLTCKGDLSIPLLNHGVSERRLRPLPQKQRTLHEKILEEIKQERRLRPVGDQRWGTRGFGSLPCILSACSGDVKSTSCINLSVPDAGSSVQRSRPRVLLKAPTLAEMEEMTTSEEEESPCGEVALKRDRSFSEHDLAQLRSEMASGLQPATQPPGGTEPPRPRAGSVHTWKPSTRDQGSCPVSVQSQPDPRSPQLSSLSSADGLEASAPDARHLWLEFHHPVESLALTVEEVVGVRRVLVKAEMEKFAQDKELFSSLKRGKICCCCRAKFPLFSWPPTCLFCKRAVCTSCSVKMKMPSKKCAHIPVYTLGFESPQRAPAAKTATAPRRDVFQSLQGPQWRSVEEEFPHIYAHGCTLKDVCSDCTSFVAHVVRSSRKSVDVLNATPRRSRQTQSLYVPSNRTLDFQ